MGAKLYRQLELYELVKSKYLKEVWYLPKERESFVVIQNKDVIIRFFNRECHCITITAKMDNEQNREIYNIVKNELLNTHEPYQDFIEIVEDKETDENPYSFFAIGIRKGSKNEEVRNVEDIYMNYLLNIIFEFDKDVCQKAQRSIKENKDLHIIVHGEEETKYEIFI